MEGGGVKEKGVERVGSWEEGEKEEQEEVGGEDGKEEEGYTKGEQVEGGRKLVNPGCRFLSTKGRREQTLTRGNLRRLEEPKVTQGE